MIGLFKYPRSLLSAVREYMMRWRLGIPYVYPMHVGTTSFDFIIANVEGYRWFSRPIDYTYAEGAATVYFASHIVPDSIVVDVGAHHGFYTLLSASLLGAKGRVIAFEANRINFEILKKNIKLNHFTNVRAYCAFVGDSSVKHRFIHRCKLDDMLEGVKPALIKIDVEGAENQVLNGAKKVIDSARPNFICELHPMKGADITEIIKFFRSRSYRLSMVREKNPMVTENLLTNRHSIYDNDILIAEPNAARGIL